MKQWIEWNPIENSSHKYYILDIDYTEGKLEVNLVSSKKSNINVELNFIFPEVYSYKIINESFTVKDICALEKQYGFTVQANKTLFKVLHSKDLQEISELFSVPAEKIIHFSFIGPHYALEVISPEEPNVKVLNN